MFLNDEEKFKLYRGYNPDFYHRALANNRERARERKRQEDEERRNEILRKWEEKKNAQREAGIKAELEVVFSRTTFKSIQARACKVFKVSPSELRSERRGKEIAFARQFIFYWSVRLTRLSYPQIGRAFERDHTTVMHGARVYPEKRAEMGRFIRAIR